jgi:hypothetical protein
LVQVNGWEASFHSLIHSWSLERGGQFFKGAEHAALQAPSLQFGERAQAGEAKPKPGSPGTSRPNVFCDGIDSAA